MKDSKFTPFGAKEEALISQEIDAKILRIRAEINKLPNLGYDVNSSQ